MLTCVWGTDSRAAQAHIQKTLLGKGTQMLTITDVHTTDDVQSVLSSGLFGEEKPVLFRGVLQNQELRTLIIGALPRLKESSRTYVIREEKIDALTKKQIEKYAESTNVFEVAKVKEATTVFALANALQKRDKKALWVGLQREWVSGNQPEAVHGVLFWAAKQEILRRETPSIRSIVARLAELPHEARRKGVELECALERFVLAEV